MRLVAAAASIAFAAGACATGALTDASLTKAWAADYEPSDFPTLRGSAPYVPGPPRHVNWGGFYGGGQIGYGASSMDFSKAGNSINAFDSNVTLTAPFGSVSRRSLCRSNDSQLPVQSDLRQCGRRRTPTRSPRSLLRPFPPKPFASC